MKRWRLTIAQNEFEKSDWAAEKLILEYENRETLWDALCNFDDAKMPGRYVKFTIEKIEVNENEENDPVAGDGNDNSKD